MPAENPNTFLEALNDDQNISESEWDEIRQNQEKILHSIKDPDLLNLFI